MCRGVNGVMVGVGGGGGGGALLVSFSGMSNIFTLR